MQNAKLIPRILSSKQIINHVSEQSAIPKIGHLDTDIGYAPTNQSYSEDRSKPESSTWGHIQDNQGRRLPDCF